MRRRYRPTDLDTIQISFAGRPATQRPLLSPGILSLRCRTFNCQSFTQFIVFLPCPPSPAPLALFLWAARKQLRSLLLHFSSLLLAAVRPPPQNVGLLISASKNSLKVTCSWDVVTIPVSAGDCQSLPQHWNNDIKDQFKEKLKWL